MTEENRMLTLISDETDAAPARGPDVEIAFTRLARALADAVIEATDAGDDGAFARALSYRAAVRRIADRWLEGEPNPTRKAKGEKEHAP
ncbi:MAG: hypothetical protein K2X74_00595 [Acetobacteraceae bacterium]|nr:hypothetical protein [Acetobacteraceae bacterium]